MGLEYGLPVAVGSFDFFAEEDFVVVEVFFVSEILREFGRVFHGLHYFFSDWKLWTLI